MPNVVLYGVAAVVLYEPYQGLKFEIQAAFSTTKPCVSKTEQRPITAERAGVSAANS